MQRRPERLQRRPRHPVHQHDDAETPRMAFERLEEGADLLDEEEHARRQRHVDDRRGLAGRARRRPARGGQHLDVVEAGGGRLLAQPRRHAGRAIEGAHAADAAGERDREPSRARADLEPVVLRLRERLQQRQLGRGVGVRAGREDVGHRAPLVGGRRLLAHPLALLGGGALERAPGGERLRLGRAQRASGLVCVGGGVWHRGHGTTEGSGADAGRLGDSRFALTCSCYDVLRRARRGPGKRRSRWQRRRSTRTTQSASCVARVSTKRPPRASWRS